MKLTSWLPKNLSQAELHLLQTLERLRLSNRGRLFALIADPNRRYRRVCALYLAWLQRHAMPLANAAIGVPRLSDPDVPRPSLRRLSRFLGSDPIPPVRHYRHQLQIDFAARRSDLYAIPRAHFFAARRARLMAQRQARSAANPPQAAIPILGVTASRRQHRRLLFVPTPSRNTGSDGVSPSASSSIFCSGHYPPFAAEGGTPSLPKAIA